MQTSRHLVVGAILLALAVSLAVLPAGAPVSAQADRAGKMIIGIPNEPESLDLHRATARITKKIQYFMNDPLIHQHPETMRYLPGLAESWEVSRDGLAWTFRLRRDVRFHNGDPLTAQDFKYTFERITHPDTKALAAKLDLGPVDRIEVVDTHTFRVHFTRPYAPFYTYLAHGWLMPLNRRAVEQHGANYGQNPVGTGPFVFRSWKPGESITVARNAAYRWGPSFYQNQGAPHIQEIEFRLIPEVQISMIGLQTGELDAVDFLADKDVETLRRDANIELFHVYLPGVGLYAFFNTQKAPWREVAVRRAANHAIDRKRIVEVVKRGNAVVAWSPIAFHLFGYDKEAEKYGYPYNVARAKQILDEAGWRVGRDGIREKGGVRLDGVFYVRQRDDYTMAAQLIQAMFKEIGVNMRLQIYEWGTLIEGLFRGDHDFGLMGYGTPEPDYMYNVFHSSQINSWNFVRYSDRRIDQLLEQGRTTIDLDRRAAIYRQFQELVVRDLALWIPLYTDIQYTPVNKRIQGVKMHPLAWFLLNDARIAR